MKITYLIGWVLLSSSIAFLLYGIDKWKAKRDGWRVPEKQLHLAAIVGGWPGAALGRQLFRHKTQKTSFIWRFWVTGILFCGWFAFALYSCLSRSTS